MKQMFHIIINPHAGSGKTMSEWEVAEPELKRLGVSFVTSFTEGPRTAVSIASKAASEGWRNFIAVGGDGTVHEVFSGIMEYVDSASNLESESVALASDFSLAVIPIGSGNDWIKSTMVPNNPLEAVRLIAKGSYAKQDVVRVMTDTRIAGYMVNIGGVGFDARVCVRVNRRKAQGHRSRFIYVEALLNTLFHYRSCPMKIECDGEEVYSGKCYTIALANGKYSGGGFRQTSELTTLDDGILDMSVVPDINAFQFMTKVFRLLDGTLYKTRPVLAFRGRRISITPTSDRREYFEVDGEVLGQMPLTVEILPSQINILVGKPIENQKVK